MEVMAVLDKSQCTAKPFHSLGISCFFQRFDKVRMFTCIKVFVYANCSMIRTLIVLIGLRQETFADRMNAPMNVNKIFSQ